MMRLRGLIRPRGRHRAVPAAEEMAVLPERADVLVLAWCPECTGRLWHDVRPDGLLECACGLVGEGAR